MTAVEVCGLLLGSTALSALITKLGEFLLEKRKHKNAREDRAEERQFEKEDKNDAVMEKLNSIEAAIANFNTKLDEHEKKDQEKWADNARTMILRFADEIKQGMRHTEEHFNQILDCIKRYRDFCRDNPDYPNTKAECAIELIEENYKERMLKNDFL